MKLLENDKPIFIQLAEQLEEGILNGAYPEEGQIPSITEFSVAYQINPATALKGVNILVDSGLVYKKRGVGMFVSEGARNKVMEKRKESFYNNYLLPLINEANNLKISPEELISMMKRGIEDVH